MRTRAKPTITVSGRIPVKLYERLVAVLDLRAICGRDGTMRAALHAALEAWIEEQEIENGSK